MGKAFNNGEMDGIFAGTLPLEALGCIVHQLHQLVMERIFAARS